MIVHGDLCIFFHRWWAGDVCGNAQHIPPPPILSPYIYIFMGPLHGPMLPRPCHGHATATTRPCMPCMHGHFHCHATVMNACPKRCMMERARVYRSVKAQPCPPLYIYSHRIYHHPSHPSYTPLGLWAQRPQGPICQVLEPKC